TGAVEVKEFVLTHGAEEGEFDYQFIASQLVPDFGRSKGTAIVSVVVRRGEESETISLTDLPGSTSGYHDIDFGHFQSLNGRIRVPPGLEVQQVIVDIQPGSDNLLGTSDSFAWLARGDDDIALKPAPPDETESR
ncbi:MAG: DUF6776 family protein, partial [Thiohalocapsa sp.]